MATDWSVWGHEELGIEAIQKLTGNKKKLWGWVDGMFEGGSDDYIALRFANGFDYEPVTRALWRKLCEKAELVVDVGTHSGLFTLDAYRSGAKAVLSVEPHPINYSRLVLNLRYNGFRSDGAFYGALGDRDGVDALLVKAALVACHAAGRVGMKNPNGMELPVRIARMDTLLAKEVWPKLKVVKIDAENWTPNVLVGMGKILEGRPDLIIECTSPGMGEILKDYGYRYWRIWETGKIEEVEDLEPYNPGDNYNGTDENCRNRLASVRDLP